MPQILLPRPVRLYIVAMNASADAAANIGVAPSTRRVIAARRTLAPRLQPAAQDARQDANTLPKGLGSLLTCLGFSLPTNTLPRRPTVLIGLGAKETAKDHRRAVGVGPT